jgi:hypothetical protein
MPKMRSHNEEASGGSRALLRINMAVKQAADIVVDAGAARIVG